MRFSASDFQSALLGLFPRGPIWSREPGSMLDAVCAILALPYARSSARAEFLLQDAFPATAEELLPEWEASLGLPDPCAGESNTLQQRQAQVVARLTYAGGASIADIEAFAQSLGYQISISQYRPAVAGRMCAGDACMGAAWAFAWQVNEPGTTVTYFRAGHSAAGEPLASWGNAVLECEIRRIAPVHTVVRFAQAAGTVASDLGEFTLGLSALGGA